MCQLVSVHLRQEIDVRNLEGRQQKIATILVLMYIQHYVMIVDGEWCSRVILLSEVGAVIAARDNGEVLYNIKCCLGEKLPLDVIGIRSSTLARVSPWLDWLLFGARPKITTGVVIDSHYITKYIYTLSRIARCRRIEKPKWSERFVHFPFAC